MVNNKSGKISRIEINNKINWRKVTKKTIEKLHSLTCNHPKVVNSPLKIYHVHIKDHTTSEVIKTQKITY